MLTIEDVISRISTRMSMQLDSVLSYTDVKDRSYVGIGLSN